MKLEEKEALQELLKRIPENELNDAVGGLSERNKEILIAASVFLGGAVVGVGSKLLYDRYKSKGTPGPKKETEKLPEQGVSQIDLLKGKIIAAYKNPKHTNIGKLYKELYKLEHPGKQFTGSKADVELIVGQWKECQ